MIKTVVLYQSNKEIGLGNLRYYRDSVSNKQYIYRLLICTANDKFLDYLDDLNDNGLQEEIECVLQKELDEDKGTIYMN